MEMKALNFAIAECQNQTDFTCILNQIYNLASNGKQKVYSFFLQNDFGFVEPLEPFQRCLESTRNMAERMLLKCGGESFSREFLSLRQLSYKGDPSKVCEKVVLTDYMKRCVVYSKDEFGALSLPSFDLKSYIPEGWNGYYLAGGAIATALTIRLLYKYCRKKYHSYR